MSLLKAITGSRRISEACMVLCGNTICSLYEAGNVNWMEVQPILLLIQYILLIDKLLDDTITPLPTTLFIFHFIFFHLCLMIEWQWWDGTILYLRETIQPEVKDLIQVDVGIAAT